MSDVWDRASEVIARRLGSFALILALLVWLPGLVRGAVQVAATPPGAVGPLGPGALAAALIGLAATALAVLAHLALVALACDPAIAGRAALRVAAARFWAYVGVMLPVAIAALLVFAPVGVAIAAAYPSMAAMRTGAAPTLSPGIAAFIALYGIAATLLVVWVQARVLAVLVPVVVAERRGLGSYARALRLTRGLTWRIVGVLLVFAVVAVVAGLAVQSVVGIAARLLFGADAVGWAQLVTAAAVSLVACAVLAVTSAFGAQLYFATREPLPVG